MICLAKVVESRYVFEEKAFPKKKRAFASFKSIVKNDYMMI